jgi:transposase
MSQITLLTGPERRRRWPEEDRHRILAAAFAPGAIVLNVARQFDVASSLIYKWRQRALAAKGGVGFAPAVVMDEARGVPGSLQMAVITVDLAGGGRVSIGSAASAALITACDAERAPMIPIPNQVRVWIATGHTDMRRYAARRIMRSPRRRCERCRGFVVASLSIIL